MHAQRWGRSVLYYGASAESVEIVSLLVSRGADVNAASDDGFTPLHIASSKRHLSMMDRDH